MRRDLGYRAAPGARRLVGLCLLLFCIVFPDLVRGQSPRQLGWPDLVPKADSENPLAKLSRNQLLKLADIAAVRDRIARGDQVSPIDAADEQAAARSLKEAGIDVDSLLAKRDLLIAQRQQRARMVIAALDGQLVRLPGYVLPLEFEGKRLTEFLLVPWVGACVHTPPPPPNQIVHVKSSVPVEFSGMFMPVWVTGQMSTLSTRKSVPFVDGASDIDIGYKLQATRVERYQE